MYSDNENESPIKKLPPKAVVINAGQPGAPVMTGQKTASAGKPDQAAPPSNSIKTNLVLFKTDTIKGTSNPNFKFSQQFYYSVNNQVCFVFLTFKIFFL